MSIFERKKVQKKKDLKLKDFSRKKNLIFSIFKNIFKEAIFFL